MALGTYSLNCHTSTRGTLSLYVQLGTCAMKSRADKGVVDARLNVYGVTNLKVADLSIVPEIVGTVSS
jgi:choline dehydrogenase-like flavoprotein